MTLNYVIATILVIILKVLDFIANYLKLVEGRPILSAIKNVVQSFVIFSNI